MNKIFLGVLVLALALFATGCDVDSSELCLNTGAGLAQEYCGE